MSASVQSRSEMRKADPEAPPVTRTEMLRCQLHEWYPRFRSVSLKTKTISLDQDFVAYLLADGLILPEGCEPPKIKVGSGQQYEYDSDGWSDEDGPDEEDSEPAARPRFDQLVREMNEMIEELGGSIFPKLNWSSPRDAIWINAGEDTKCMSAGEVIMLLKSSDFIVHDLCHPFDCCQGTGLEAPDNPPTGEIAEAAQSTSATPPQVMLNLRKWYDIKPSYEFRCFVNKRRMVAACQRDVTNFYEFLLDKELQTRLVNALSSFFVTELLERFPSDSFVFDAYVRERDFRVFLIDVNPFGGLTQPLLYSWGELTGGEVGSDSPELRLIGDHPSIRPSMSMYGRLPKDMQDVSNQESINELVRSVAEFDDIRQAENH